MFEMTGITKLSDFNGVEGILPARRSADEFARKSCIFVLVKVRGLPERLLSSLGALEMGTDREKMFFFFFFFFFFFLSFFLSFFFFRRVGRDSPAATQPPRPGYLARPSWHDRTGATHLERRNQNEGTGTKEPERRNRKPD